MSTKTKTTKFRGGINSKSKRSNKKYNRTRKTKTAKQRGGRDPPHGQTYQKQKQQSNEKIFQYNEFAYFFEPIGRIDNNVLDEIKDIYNDSDDYSSFMNGLNLRFNQNRTHDLIDLTEEQGIDELFAKSRSWVNLPTKRFDKIYLTHDVQPHI